ncbi:TetR/AcrR family transcriptional regulator [Streptomyces ipomoeae]|uniref:TetR/AcrR family transcriptional regulator n=1 Tax=Streptomyces ipomoeae TaxID=103232 RepID=UPI001FCFD6B9|nr:TetR/AcrR family transcriptional regulator [Streptomyces ipomoeae]MDX2937647.1 TetR/AcrR family transcriptional regulator [Streptomyces ipomoeae]
MVAAELFARHGYHNVSVNDIAAAAGISGPAIYRHFSSKQALLAHILRAGLEQALRIIDERLGPAAPGRAPDPEERLRGVFEELTAYLISHPEVGVLWRRERRHLAGPERAAVALIMGRAADLLVGELRRLRTELTPTDAELLAWAGVSVLGSISDHQVRLPRAAFERLLVTIASNVITAEIGVPAANMPSRSPHVEPPLLDARREQLVAVTARLFRDHGYHAVTMEDIGAAAGIAGPSIYSHFSSKSELLQTIADRIRERLRQTTAQAHAADRPPRKTLDLLVGYYVDTVLDYRDLVAAYFSEGHNLPQREAAELRRFQRAYTLHWADLIRTVMPQLPEKQARIQVHAAFSVVNDIAQTRRFTSRPGRLAAELRTLMLTVLTVTDPGSRRPGPDAPRRSPPAGPTGSPPGCGRPA